MIRSIPRPVVRTNQVVIFATSVLTIVTGQALLLLIPLIANLLGLVGFNPIMRIAALCLRKPKSSYIPEDVDQQRFNSYIAIACLALSFVGFMLGADVIGYAFSAMVAIASGIALCGFCIGCFLHFQLKQWQYRRSLSK
ncbi:MAG: DUF4395 domain-containing protein [Caryophanon sp.]|nr:DUF4395 domain-containing protein [Caryophanon sp.]